jgi:hypothetical protein
MKTKIVPLIGEPVETLYQLGLRERDAFLRLEARVRKLLSTNQLLGFGQEVVTRAKVLLRKRGPGYFDACVEAYARGLGIEPVRYHSFLGLFELAAHYGQAYPELKALLPGCTSVITRRGADLIHARLLDFPLVGIFEDLPRLYYWQAPGKEPLLTYSCEGLAPLFFQAVHGAGVSFAVHHKPGNAYFSEGQGIFQVIFEALLQSKTFGELKKDLRRRQTLTKWSLVLLDKGGAVHAVDLDGPSQNSESYDANTAGPLIFTNIPLKGEPDSFRSFIRFSEDRQNWVKERLCAQRDRHLLDLLTDVEAAAEKGWLHPAGTLATVGAWAVNLGQGLVDLKEGTGALTGNDALLRVNLGKDNDLSLLRPAAPLTPFEEAWKRASRAQAAFDQGDYDVAYHELQMAHALTPDEVWRSIFTFYLCLWDFKFIGNSRELAQVYKVAKRLRLPPLLRDQWIFLVMRLERRLDLAPTVSHHDVSPEQQARFQQEKLAGKALFATWMKLLYPRMEILDVFSPHHR